VRDEDHRTAVRAHLAGDVEHPHRQVGGQRGGDLVEQEQLRLECQRAGEVEQAQGRPRELARHGLEVETAEAELIEVTTEGRHGRGGEPEVLHDRQVG
jgi:hypothetical protein